MQPMGREASKTRALFGELERAILTGQGIDIGCGSDPVTPEVQCFDVEHGDANTITRHVHGMYDFVFSCHCLEHMPDPRAALEEWWKLVRPGGHLILVVPDEDLYEQGFFPSLFNSDHRATFTIRKATSWSPCSYNVLDLVEALPGARVRRLELQDAGYDHTLLFTPRGTSRSVRRWRRLVKRAAVLLRPLGLDRMRLSRLFRVPVDQTRGPAMAQIYAVVQREPHA